LQEVRKYQKVPGAAPSVLSAGPFPVGSLRAASNEATPDHRRVNRQYGKRPRAMTLRPTCQILRELTHFLEVSLCLRRSEPKKERTKGIASVGHRPTHKTLRGHGPR